jgi:hypothetical protein
MNAIMTPAHVELVDESLEEYVYDAKIDVLSYNLSESARRLGAVTTSPRQITSVPTQRYLISRAMQSKRGT